jgi:acetyltransferase
MSLTLKPKARDVGCKELPPTDAGTRTGVPLSIRAALPEDVSLLANIYGHLSARDMRFRFKQPIEHLGPEELKNLVDREAGMTSYLAFSGDTAIACATLVRDAGSDAAEVILSVRPDWKARGVSWTLLEDVLARAAAAGLTRVSSVELGEDREAINLQREMGFVARLKSADPLQFSLVKALDASPPPARETDA